MINTNQHILILNLFSWFSKKNRKLSVPTAEITQIEIKRGQATIISDPKAINEIIEILKRSSIQESAIGENLFSKSIKIHLVSSLAKGSETYQYDAANGLIKILSKKKMPVYTLENFEKLNLYMNQQIEEI